jgi:hypothetical protein
VATKTVFSAPNQPANLIITQVAFDAVAPQCTSNRTAV